jgi:hypothetical protein
VGRAMPLTTFAVAGGPRRPDDNRCTACLLGDQPSQTGIVDRIIVGPTLLGAVLTLAPSRGAEGRIGCAIRHRRSRSMSTFSAGSRACPSARQLADAGESSPVPRDVHVSIFVSGGWVVASRTLLRRKLLAQVAHRQPYLRRSRLRLWIAGRRRARGDDRQNCSRRLRRAPASLNTGRRALEPEPWTICHSFPY